MEKKDLRKFIRMQKGRFTSQQLSEMSISVIKRLMASPKMKSANTVLMYYSLNDEVDTHDAVDRVLEQGKIVLLPKVISDTEMELRRYTGPEDLQDGFFNIMEPSGELFEDYAGIDLAVIPGMAFDSRNNRLGRGKGYYDRMLPKLVNAYKMGVCFDFQRLPGIPANENDIKMDEIV
ncbi:5-formyltetrahydrofolate cyclo-ligase [Prevotella sp. OH937_COT-195]|uniref:5-formyltetrahydrofolate cyclo-ligase n=1 Tax=Prevotella sp. OH937_COT-195 TaxID=2491051 RepID=UPI000F65538D|nr:5-formyltetrahydrofolate cyclo-ligase [Prevotella sp. OH937_COT-195]RRD03009.1 5-formyltetrahydrofolate cyclo-ligase [Prevotella sp. OH937_COT-195]